MSGEPYCCGVEKAERDFRSGLSKADLRQVYIDPDVLVRHPRGPPLVVTHHRFENQSVNSVAISGDSSSAASATVGMPFEAAMADKADGKKSPSHSRARLAHAKYPTDWEGHRGRRNPGS